MMIPIFASLQILAANLAQEYNAEESKLVLINIAINGGSESRKGDRRWKYNIFQYVSLC